MGEKKLKFTISHPNDKLIDRVVTKKKKNTRIIYLNNAWVSTFNDITPDDADFVGRKKNRRFETHLIDVSQLIDENAGVSVDVAAAALARDRASR